MLFPLQRAEHHEYMLSNLEEVALHQQNIEAIELLGQLCPKLRILYLQNNLIGKIQNLHKLKVWTPLAWHATLHSKCHQARESAQAHCSVVGCCACVITYTSCDQ